MDLIDAVATAKVKCIETTIELCFRLKNEVGAPPHFFFLFGFVVGPPPPIG